MSTTRLTSKDIGYFPRQLPQGPENSILDVPGVYVGQNTVGNDGDDARKGVTVIFPRYPDDITIPCYAGLHTLNGNGELTGNYQIKDWGYSNTQLVLNVAAKKQSPIDEVSHSYGTPIVGETADFILNHVYKSPLTLEEIKPAFENAMTQGEVQEGQYGGGAVGGVPIGRLLLKEYKELEEKERTSEKNGKIGEGSIIIILITDAPLLPHQLSRVARHCAVGLSQVGGHGVGRNHSGDIILALSTGNKPEETVGTPQVDGLSKIEINDIKVIRNESIETLFRTASEATEEAISNSIIAGRDGRTGVNRYRLEGIPVESVKELVEKYRVNIDDESCLASGEYPALLNKGVQ